jgi:phage FluMu protein Com
VSSGNDRRVASMRGHILVTCQHCQRGILVPKPRRFHEVDCPACGEVNPAPKKDRLALIKGFFRWLLYPSFQDRD